MTDLIANSNAADCSVEATLSVTYENANVISLDENQHIELNYDNFIKPFNA